MNGYVFERDNNNVENDEYDFKNEQNKVSDKMCARIIVENIASEKEGEKRDSKIDDHKNDGGNYEVFCNCDGIYEKKAFHNYASPGNAFVLK